MSPCWKYISVLFFLPRCSSGIERDSLLSKCDHEHCLIDKRNFSHVFREIAVLESYALMALQMAIEYIMIMIFELKYDIHHSVNDCPHIFKRLYDLMATGIFLGCLNASILAARVIIRLCSVGSPIGETGSIECFA